MAVRLREADSMAAVAEMRQRIAELEIQVSRRSWKEGGPPGLAMLSDRPPVLRSYRQREEGRIQGQLNHSDSSQYIRELKDQIEELKAEVRAWDVGDRPDSGSGTRMKHEARRAREEGA